MKDALRLIRFEPDIDLFASRLNHQFHEYVPYDWPTGAGGKCIHAIMGRHEGFVCFSAFLHHCQFCNRSSKAMLPGLSIPTLKSIIDLPYQLFLNLWMWSLATDLYEHGISIGSVHSMILWKCDIIGMCSVLQLTSCSGSSPRINSEQVSPYSSRKYCVFVVIYQYQFTKTCKKNTTIIIPR